MSKATLSYGAALVVIMSQGCAPTWAPQWETTLESRVAVQASAVGPAAMTPTTSTSSATTTTTMPISQPVPAVNPNNQAMLPPAPAPQPANCNDYMTQLGWENFSHPLQVDFNPISTKIADIPDVGINFYGYKGFEVLVHGLRPTSEPNFNRTFRMETSGFSIRLRDPVTNQVTAISNSDYLPQPFTGSAEDNVMISSRYFNIPDRPELTRRLMQFYVGRDFYLRSSQLGRVQVELYCFDQKVGSGVQDMRALEGLKTTYQKTATDQLGIYKNVLTAGIEASLSTRCPEEVGNHQILCSAMLIGLDKMYWVFNGKRLNNRFETWTSIGYYQGMDGVPVGTHDVQAVGVLPNGTELRSLIRTIRVR